MALVGGRTGLPGTSAAHPAPSPNSEVDNATVQLQLEIKNYQHVDFYGLETSLGFYECKYSYPLMLHPSRAMVRKYGEKDNIGGYHAILDDLKNDNILRVGPVFSNDEGEGIVMFEHVDMKLKAYAKLLCGIKPSSQLIDYQAVMDALSGQLLQGLDYLHVRSLAHGDLNYDNIYVSLDDENYDLGHVKCAQIKLRLDGQESHYASQPPQKTKKRKRSQSYNGLTKEDCNAAVDVLVKLSKNLHVKLPLEWKRFSTYLQSQTKVVMTQIRLQPNMWSIQNKILLVKAVHPYWKADKRATIPSRTFLWTYQFRRQLRYIRISNHTANTHFPNYVDTEYSYNHFGRNSLEHYDEYVPSLANSKEDFMQSLINYCPVLIEKLIYVAKRLGVEKKVMKEICLSQV